MKTIYSLQLKQECSHLLRLHCLSEGIVREVSFQGWMWLCCVESSLHVKGEIEGRLQVAEEVEEDVLQVVGEVEEDMLQVGEV